MRHAHAGVTDRRQCIGTGRSFDICWPCWMSAPYLAILSSDLCDGLLLPSLLLSFERFRIRMMNGRQSPFLDSFAEGRRHCSRHQLPGFGQEPAVYEPENAQRQDALRH